MSFITVFSLAELEGLSWVWAAIAARKYTNPTALERRWNMFYPRILKAGLRRLLRNLSEPITWEEGSQTSQLTDVVKVRSKVSASHVINIQRTHLPTAHTAIAAAISPPISPEFFPLKPRYDLKSKKRGYPPRNPPPRIEGGGRPTNPPTPQAWDLSPYWLNEGFGLSKFAHPPRTPSRF